MKQVIANLTKFNKTSENALTKRNNSKITTYMENSDDDGKHLRQLKSNDAGRPPLSIIESVADDSTSSPVINSAQQKDSSHNSSLFYEYDDQYMAQDYGASKFRKF